MRARARATHTRAQSVGVSSRGQIICLHAPRPENHIVMARRSIRVRACGPPRTNLEPLTPQGESASTIAACAPARELGFAALYMNQLLGPTHLHTFVGGFTVGAVVVRQCFHTVTVAAAAQPAKPGAGSAGERQIGAPLPVEAGGGSTTDADLARAESGAAAADRQPKKPSEHDDVIVQYVVVRKDLSKSLKWTTGPIMAQACHASCAALWLSRGSHLTQAYCSEDAIDDMTKVMMEIKNEGQLRKLSQSLTDAVSLTRYTRSPHSQPVVHCVRWCTIVDFHKPVARDWLHMCCANDRVSGTSSGWNSQRTFLPHSPPSPFTGQQSSLCSRNVSSTRASPAAQLYSV